MNRPTFDDIVDRLKTYEFINEKVDINKFLNNVETLELNKAPHIVYNEIIFSEESKEKEESEKAKNCEE